MNWHKKHSENQFFIVAYMEYLHNTSLNFNQALKIIAEIGRLHAYNHFIESMMIEDYARPVEIITITQDSKL